LDYGSQQIGATSYYYIHVLNADTHTISLAGRVAGDGAQDFGIANNCDNAIYAGNACDIQVAFRPSSAGDRADGLALQGYDAVTGAAAVRTIALHGVGAAPPTDTPAPPTDTPASAPTQAAAPTNAPAPLVATDTPQPPAPASAPTQAAAPTMPPDQSTPPTDVPAQPTTTSDQSTPPISTPDQSLPPDTQGQAAQPTATPPSARRQAPDQPARDGFVQLLHAMAPVVMACIRTQSPLIDAANAMARSANHRAMLRQAAYTTGISCSRAGESLNTVPASRSLFGNANVRWFASDIVLYIDAWAHLGSGLRVYAQGYTSPILMKQLNGFEALMSAASIDAVMQYRAIMGSAVRPRIAANVASVSQTIMHDPNPYTMDQRTLDYYASMCTVFPYYTYTICRVVQQEEARRQQQAYARYQQPAVAPLQSGNLSAMDQRTLDYYASMCDIAPYYTYPVCTQIKGEAARRQQATDVRFAQQWNSSMSSLVDMIRKQKVTDDAQHLGRLLNEATGPANQGLDSINRNDVQSAYLQLLMRG